MKPYFKSISLALLVAGIAACSQEPVTVVKKVQALRAISIYNQDSVQWYNNSWGGFNADMAASYIEKAEAIAPVDISKAIYFTKRAITLEPVQKHYDYLLKLLQESEQEAELYKLYSFFVDGQYNGKTGKYTYPFQEPSEELLYDYFIFTLTHKRAYESNTALYLARELDYSLPNFKKKLLADTRFTWKPDSDAYKNLMLLFMSDQELEAYQKSPENFKNYLATVKDTSRTFDLGEKELQAFQYRNEDREEEGMDYKYFFKNYLVEEKEMPNRWYRHEAKRKFRLNERVQAVVYAIDTSATACPVDMRHIYHRLVTYDLNGNILHSAVIGSQAGELLLTAKVYGKTIALTESKRIWKNSYDMSNFDNQLLKKEQIGERTLVIMPDGRIVPQEPLAAEVEI